MMSRAASMALAAIRIWGRKIFASSKRRLIVSMPLARPRFIASSGDMPSSIASLAYFSASSMS